MRQHRRWMVVALTAAGLVLSGCADTSESESSEAGPATLVELEGTDVKQVILTAKAAERLGITMTPVSEEGGTKVIPYASVVYDAEGATWVFTRPKQLTFVRTPITVQDIVGERALLSAGPNRGEEVVAVGTAELFGAEQEIGH